MTSIKKAIRYANRIVGQLCPHGYKQYVFYTWDAKAKASRQSMARDYWTARLARRDRVVQEALVYLGYSEEDAWMAEQFSDGTSRDIVKRFIAKYPNKEN